MIDSLIDDIDSEDDDRPITRCTAPHGAGRLGESPPSRGTDRDRHRVGCVVVALPTMKLTNIPKAKKLLHEHTSVSKLCSYLLRHDKSNSHGNDGGVAISVILDGMRLGAGGDARRPYLHTGIELFEILRKGSNKLRFVAFFVDGDRHWRFEPLRDTVVEAEPTLMDWSRIVQMRLRGFTMSRGIAAPFQSSSTVSCLDKRVNLTAATYLLSATLTPITASRSRAGGDFRNGQGDAAPEDSDNDKQPTLEGCRRCGHAGRLCQMMQVLESNSSAFFCEDKIPMVALMTIRWAASNTTIWRCDSTAKMQRSYTRAALKDNLDAPPENEESAPPFADRPSMVLRETVDTGVGV